IRVLGKRLTCPRAALILFHVEQLGARCATRGSRAGLDARAGGALAVDDLFIGGVWRGPAAGGRREIRCPADGTHVATVSEATAEDAVAAVLAAREAFDTGTWRDTPERDRGDLLLRVADLLERDRKDIARA